MFKKCIMRTLNAFKSTSNRYAIFYALSFIFLYITPVQAQRLSLYPTGQSHLFQDGLNIGLSTSNGFQPFTTLANFHIQLKHGLFSDFEPLFAFEIVDPTDLRTSAKISGLEITNNTLYGIRQIGPDAMVNCFQNKVLIGMSDFNNLASSYMLSVVGKVGLSSSLCLLGGNIEAIGIDQLPFCFRKSPTGNVLNPFSLYEWGAKVNGKIECDSFLLHNNAGFLKVLVSDENGNGSWAEASLFNDQDWLISTLGKTGTEPPAAMHSLYFNDRKYINVGIGTDRPLQKLHIADGNIMISRAPIDAPGSLNGSLLFGGLVSQDFPFGEWGLEYLDGEQYFDGGLNFRKVTSAYTQGANNCLYLKNNGNVGIGTSNPLEKLHIDGSTLINGKLGVGTAFPTDRFQVNDGAGKVTIGLGFVNVNPEHNSEDQDVAPRGYIGFNAVHVHPNWLFAGDGETNGGSLIYNDPNGAMYLCTIPSVSDHDRTLSQSAIYQNTRMRISELGKFRIGNNINEDLITEPALEVRYSGVSSIVAHTTTTEGSSESGPAYLWAVNSHNGVALMVDNDGICHLKENFTNPQSLMSFHSGDVTFSGKVGIGDVIPSDYPNNGSRLFVEGGITTEEVRVNVKGEWSDFVFSKEYNLMSISELEQFIINNKHLPEVPTTNEVTNNGVELGKMNAILLQKIEELTLYIIQLEKRMDEIQKNRN